MRDLYIKAGGGAVRNTDDSFVENAPITLDDYDFELQDPDGVVISNEIRPAMIGETFIIGSAGICPTEFSYNLNINGVFSQVVTVDVFLDINININ